MILLRPVVIYLDKEKREATVMFELNGRRGQDLFGWVSPSPRDLSPALRDAAIQAVQEKGGRGINPSIKSCTSTSITLTW